MYQHHNKQQLSGGLATTHYKTAADDADAYSHTDSKKPGEEVK